MRRRGTYGDGLWVDHLVLRAKLRHQVLMEERRRMDGYEMGE